MGDSLKDLVFLITGASGAIGRACAVELARWGAKLALTGRNDEKLQETVEKCKEQGLDAEKIFVVTGNVTVEEDVHNIVQSSVDHFGQLDALLNIAGGTVRRNIYDCQVDDLDWCYNILVRSVFMMTKMCTPHLERTKGAIVNMSSVGGIRPIYYAMPYSMCKGMVDRYTQILATSLGPKGIRVNSVNPSTVNKPGLPTSGVAADRINAYLTWCCDATPSGRLCELDELGRLVAFLCSKEADYLNGTLFPIDGAYANTSYIPKLQ